jgi:hypothetical protein
MHCLLMLGVGVNKEQAETPGWDIETGDATGAYSKRPLLLGLGK